ncbi:MAG TPA: S53 family peptidase [Jatrophihabitantaceae bacterium]
MTSGPRTVTLVTGDRVVVAPTSAGQPSVTLAPGGAVTSQGFQVLASGPHLYVIPQVAAGYIGAPLDLSLFDVGSDTANYAEPGTVNYALPMTATYASGQPAMPVPGATANGATANGAQLTLRDPAAFGRALAREWTAAKRGAPSGRLFAGISHLTRAGASGHGNPPGKLYTVTVKAIDRRGHRVTGDLGAVMNADNVDNFLAAQGFYNGELAFSVPAGTYSVDAYISTAYADNSIDFTLAAAPEVRVTRDTTVVLDARRGKRVSADVGHPAQQVTAQLNFQRNPATGVSFTDSFTSFGPTALYATPTEQVHTGQLYFYSGLRLGGPDGSVQQQLYDMEFPSVGAIPSTLSHTLPDSDFATVETRFHSAVPDRAELEAREGQMPWQAVQVFAADQVVAPDARTEHVYAAPPDMRWLQQVVLDNADSLAMESDIVRAYQPGQHTTTDWAAQPMAPGIEQEAVAGQDCPACRAGNTLNLTLFGATDAAGHLMLPDPTVTESLALYQNGQPVGRPIPSGFASFPLSADPASYQLVYDTTRDAAWWPSSTRTHTAWAFTSAPRPADPLPPGWSCGGKGSGGGGKGAAADQGCSFEPLLFTKYATGAGSDDVVPAGQDAQVEVDVAHQLGAPATAITSFAAQVSYDDGTTWTDVPATRLTDGRYRLDYSQPVLSATDGFASLHVTAADANGSAIDQTITRAYPLAVPAPAPPSGQPGAPPQQACNVPTVVPDLQCMAIVNAAAGASADQPTGLAPADIQAAYRVPNAGPGRTIAIVDAYDDPNAESDLSAYRAQYGLPPCTTANGCFTKVNQQGKTAPLPAPDPGWGLEISLDLDAVSATCPACHILLVEANTPNTGDLLTGVLTADANHVDAISNSYGSRGEFSGEQTLEHYYRDLRTPAVFATGDYGYGNGAILIGGISYPAASRYVIAVGGTSLVRDQSERGWTETAWDGATSGCSAYIHKPSWQHDQLCDMRTVADISAVADPGTGLAVRDTFGYDGWVQVGGTSLAAPIVSSLYAMGGGSIKDLYRDRSAVNDVVGGSNGTNCSDTYLCAAVPGYDGPTGLGTPDASDRYWRAR